MDSITGFIGRIRDAIGNMLSNIHIPTPHISVNYTTVPLLGNVPSGISVDWYGMGGQFVANAPMLIGVGEAGPELVTVQRTDGRGYQPGGTVVNLTYAPALSLGSREEMYDVMERVLAEVEHRRGRRTH